MKRKNRYTAIILLCFSLISQTGYGQLYIDGKDINQIPGVSILELLTDDLLRNYSEGKGWYSIEYGQSSRAPNTEKRKNRISDSIGVEIMFNNQIAVINYIASKGWDLFNISDPPYEKVGYAFRTSWYLYTFKKKEK